MQSERSRFPHMTQRVHTFPDLRASCFQGGGAPAAEPPQSAPGARDSNHAVDGAVDGVVDGAAAAAAEQRAAAAEQRAARLAKELEEAMADANVARAELATEICSRQVGGPLPQLDTQARAARPGL